MITPEEKESIVLEAVERAMKALPELTRHLVISRTSADRIKLEFLEKLLKDEPKYKNYLEVIKDVVTELEGKNPGKDINKLLDEALPEVKKRVGIVEKADTVTVNKPSIEDLKFKSNLGEL